jgi:hypothetical protein
MARLRKRLLAGDAAAGKLELAAARSPLRAAR